MILNLAVVHNDRGESTSTLIGYALKNDGGLIHEKVILVLDIIAQDVVKFASAHGLGFGFFYNFQAILQITSFVVFLIIHCLIISFERWGQFDDCEVLGRLLFLQVDLAEGDQRE